MDKDIKIDTPVAKDMICQPKFPVVKGMSTSQVLGESRGSPFIPYNALAIIKLIKGTKIEVLFNNGTIQLTNDGKEVGVL
ncbi:hypothetical protein E2320_001791 [Naja naja]|nr:hypothetical protein E2320_001791 [Naja naja]